LLKTLESTCVLEDFAPGPDGAVYEGREAIEAYMKKEFSGKRRRCTSKSKRYPAMDLAVSSDGNAPGKQKAESHKHCGEQTSLKCGTA